MHPIQPKTPAAAALPPFDKYFYYAHSVQAPDENMEFLRDMYFEQRRPRHNLILREDFCGTFANSIAWVMLDPQHVAHGLDLDPEPIAYGRAQYLPHLPAEAAARLHISEGDVLTSPLVPCDIAAALNFSYCFFRDRKTLGHYFRRVFESVAADGLFVLDLLGGPFYNAPNEHELELEDPHPFSYFLEQHSYDPITADARYSIHFKRPGEAKRKHVFAYTFRLWTVPELRDLLLEVGFSKVVVYWEGTKRDGSGDGVWRPTAVGDPSDSWLTYIVALK